MSETFEFSVTPEAMLPAPCPWWKRLWLKLRRKPLPTIQPEGTRPLIFESRDGDVITRTFIPAARIEPKSRPLSEETTPQ